MLVSGRAPGRLLEGSGTKADRLGLQATVLGLPGGLGLPIQVTSGPERSGHRHFCHRPDYRE